MLQVVARIVLPYGGHIVKDGTIGEYGFQSNCVSVQRVVLNEMNTASISCQIATDHARSFRSKIKWDLMFSLRRISLQVLQNTASLCSQNPI